MDLSRFKGPLGPDPGWIDRSGNVYSGDAVWDAADEDEDLVQELEDAGLYGNYHDMFGAVTGLGTESLLARGWARWAGKTGDAYFIDYTSQLTRAQRKAVAARSEGVGCKSRFPASTLSLQQEALKAEKSKGVPQTTDDTKPESEEPQIIDMGEGTRAVPRFTFRPNS